jgi:N-acetylneuraminic acid mutarotase
MIKSIHTLIVLTTLFGISACGGESGRSDVTSQSKKVNINGAVEKGPFIVGSTVTINILTEEGQNTDSTIVTNTIDDLGNFRFSVEENELFQTTASGYYRNEVTGELSSGVLTLRSIYKSTSANEQYAYVNLLTHLVSNRVVQLINNGSISYEQAITQAESEFLSTFEQVISTPGDTNFTSFSIFENEVSSGSAYLLAISTIIYQYAIDLSKENGSSPDAELAQLINQIEEDFAEDGILDDDVKIARLRDTHTRINPAEVIRNVQSWVGNSDDYEIPDLNQYLDSDLDGFVNANDLDDDNDGINDIDDSSPYSADFNIVDQDIITNEDTSIAIDISSNNPFGEEINVTITSAPSFGNLVVEYPKVRYLPNDNYNGVDHFDYVLSQRDLTSTEVTVSISILPVNDDPVISGSPATTIEAGNEYRFTPSVLNIENDLLVFSIENKPVWAGFDTNTGTLSGTPTNEEVGQSTNIVIHVSDGATRVSLSGFSIEVLTNPWVALPSMPTARHSPTSVAIGDKIYVIGGYNNESLNKIEVFDISTRSWTSKPNMQVARYSHTANAIDNQIYVMGGGWSFNSVEAYDIDSQSWSSKASMGTPRNSHSSCVYDGRIYVFGGRNQNTALSSVEMYDPSTDAWDYKASNSKLYFGSSCVTVGDEIYVFGGAKNENGFEVYDPSLDAWVRSGQLSSTKRYGFSAELIGNFIYLIGGYNFLDNVDVLNLADSSWSTGKAMPKGRHNAGSVVIDGVIYIVGGRDADSNSINTFEKYDPSLE